MRLATGPATAIFVSCVSAAAAMAESRPIKGETIKVLISGGTVHLDTPIGAALPLKFEHDGTVTGSSVVLAFYLGSTSDQGRWRISGNKLCTKWTRWFKRKESCMMIRPEGYKFAWTMDDGDTGTASIQSNTKRLFGSGSALTGGISAAAMVRNAEERLAATMAKPVHLAALSAPSKPQLVPQSQTQTRLEPAKAVPVIADHPQAWLPMSMVIAASKATPVKVAYVAPSRTEAPPPAFRVARVAAGDVLNMRRDPIAGSQIVGTIPPDASGLVLSGICQPDWCPVLYRQQHGWVSHQFLERE